MMQEDVVEPANTELDSTSVFVPNRDSSLRFCADCSNHNSVTVRDWYPLPMILDFIDPLREARIFSSLNANLLYLLVSIHGRARLKTVFTSHYRLPIRANATWLQKHIGNDPMNNEDRVVVSEMVIGADVRRHHLDIFQQRQTAHGPFATSIQPAWGCRSIAQVA